MNTNERVENALAALIERLNGCDLGYTYPLTSTERELILDALDPLDKPRVRQWS